jgi:hypothetical protein
MTDCDSPCCISRISRRFPSLRFSGLELCPNEAIEARLTPAAPPSGAAAIDLTTGELVPGVTLRVPAGEVFHARTEDGAHHGCDL